MRLCARRFFPVLPLVFSASVTYDNPKRLAKPQQSVCPSSRRGSRGVCVLPPSRLHDGARRNGRQQR